MAPCGERSEIGVLAPPPDEHNTTLVCLSAFDVSAVSHTDKSNFQCQCYNGTVSRESRRVGVD
eukprot:1099420-Amphidinium_carterae.1